MITAFIVLTVIALALGAYIVYDALHGRNNPTLKMVAEPYIPQAVEEPAPEHETVNTTEPDEAADDEKTTK